MPYQKPKADHPWRRYQNKFETKKKKKYTKTVKIFVREIINNWDNVEIYTTAYGKSERYHLNELSQNKQAAWLVGLIKKVYGQSY